MIFFFFSVSVLSILLLHLSFLRVSRDRVLPLQWPVIGMLPALIVNVNRLHDYVTSVLQESGWTFVFKGPWLMGLDFVVTCDPANAKHIYTSHFSNYPKGEKFSEVFDIFGYGIFTVDGDLWSKHRKMANALMSGGGFRSSVAEYSREKVEKTVLPILDGLARLDRAFDLQAFLKRFALDVTSSLVLGKDPGCLAEDLPSIPFAKAVEDAAEVLAHRHVVPAPWWKLLKRLRLGEERKMASATDVIERFIAGCIEEKRDAGKHDGASDLLTSYMYGSDHLLLDITEETVSYFRSDKFLRDTLLTLLSAGVDTTATALSWFFWLLCRFPNVEEKILEELRGVEHERVAFDLDDVEGLVYFHAALCESLRLYPPIPFNLKVPAADDVLPSGHCVREGTRILFVAYATGRMEKHWGEDCSEFRPERWIDASTGQLKRVNAHEFLAFHSGPRSCVGKNMAFTQMKVAAAALIYNFRFELEEGCKVEPKLSIMTQMKNGLKVKILKR